MKVRQEFDVAEPIDRVWAFFERPVDVARCIPGVEQVSLEDDDTLSVIATQRVGPISATFDTKVEISERVPEERIQFTSIGRAVRGAAGDFRSTNTVHLHADGGRTHVLVEGDAALAGVLGTVGHKVIMKQAEKITAAFARNLERALSGTETPESGWEQRDVSVKDSAAAALATPHAGTSPAASDRWAKIAALLSGVAAFEALVILVLIGTS